MRLRRSLTLTREKTRRKIGTHCRRHASTSNSCPANSSLSPGNLNQQSFDPETPLPHWACGTCIFGAGGSERVFTAL